MDVTVRPVRKVFTTRAGGFSQPPFESFNLGDHVGDDPYAVAANRRRLAEVLKLPTEAFVWMEQIHSAHVTVVDRPQQQAVEATDCLVTTTKGLALVVLVADCVPVLLSDTDAGVIAACHAGRMGARNGIVRKTVETMVSLGARPHQIHALLGPAASGLRYEVPREMALDVEKRLPGAHMCTQQGTDGLDIRRGIIRQLLGLGVRAIDSDPRCTIESPEFFSYRREQKTGRQAGVIWLQ
ncbi:Laccase domain protein yfiH [Corynebacterium kutscheri]|uniref:Purine nucleoside phosphorylase n=1 Tax=Corynebacterium kutscheri TaxID=35755 RepID=A0A0F6TDF0_9CORY|nr:peptidoglycan editing factor PgeF [Corynebacterium kutscheri]AKE41556.1 YfiH family protein [Corynebacterium kutscheri]VEH08835.1 Laccase domain protein yfiH [Corynebacterium kutscheri]VEH09880.1 Laccase domain protein yfiH [Corynebacterium kutscheri]VEH79964.1 Laccase domain protein yfiH [Corynebacterium kutscheri]